MKKKYFYGVSLLLFVLAMIGLILPALFSARSNEAVILAIALSIVSPLVVVRLFKLISNQEVKNETK